MHPWISRKSNPETFTDPYKKLYQSPRWRTMRSMHLSTHALCEMCAALELTTPATVVDHRIPVRSGKVDFWDQSNWQSLCAHHHNKKRNDERGSINYIEQWQHPQQ
jgi:5-methylcytosine-specific restriction protein A